ncbi:hypothetical protein [Actinoplanes sp. NBRC 101535]|uniref:hypothetical protein n=1 Tax=Actinoplanes sp. NBRC 101535 TaxID=3032196 RepID=UPI0024A5EBCF|nr:hypothetical protein [Actinoplanes sp. NBRC 101535]GLY06861.1 hypothetical protein Acsp01_72400 [Actinoplanes sp. NBRC 101535]
MLSPDGSPAQSALLCVVAALWAVGTVVPALIGVLLWRHGRRAIGELAAAVAFLERSPDDEFSRNPEFVWTDNKCRATARIRLAAASGVFLADLAAMTWPAGPCGRPGARTSRPGPAAPDPGTEQPRSRGTGGARSRHGTAAIPRDRRRPVPARNSRDPAGPVGWPPHRARADRLGPRTVARMRNLSPDESRS